MSNPKFGHALQSGLDHVRPSRLPRRMGAFACPAINCQRRAAHRRRAKSDPTQATMRLTPNPQTVATKKTPADYPSQQARPNVAVPANEPQPSLLVFEEQREIRELDAYPPDTRQQRGAHASFTRIHPPFCWEAAHRTDFCSEFVGKPIDVPPMTMCDAADQMAVAGSKIAIFNQIKAGVGVPMLVFLKNKQLGPLSVDARSAAKFATSRIAGGSVGFASKSGTPKCSLSNSRQPRLSRPPRF